MWDKQATWEMDYSYQQCHLKHITIVTCHYEIFWVLQLLFVTKIQLHTTHATANLCSCLRQVAHDSVPCNITCATCIYNVNIHFHPYIPI